MSYHFTGGLGDASTGSLAPAAANIGSNLASNKGGSKYVSSAGQALLAAAPMTGPAAPFVAAAGAALSIMGAMGVGDGCGVTCLEATAYANQSEKVIRQATDTYFAQPAPRTVSQQQAALAIFDALWLDLSDKCGNSQLGKAGKNCTGDRQQGACKWHQTGDSPWPGGPAKGACWNWFSAYRDPIANDSPIVPDPTPVSSDLNSILSAAGGSSSNLIPLILVAGLVFLAVKL